DLVAAGGAFVHAEGEGNQGRKRPFHGGCFRRCKDAKVETQLLLRAERQMHQTVLYLAIHQWLGRDFMSLYVSRRIGHGGTEREVLHSGPRGAAKRRPRRCNGRRALTGRRGREEETDTCENARNKQPLSIHKRWVQPLIRPSYIYLSSQSYLRNLIFAILISAIL